MFSDFKSISDVIKKSREFNPLREAVLRERIIEEFYNIFPELKTIAEPVKVHKDKLILKVENSVWKSELNFRKTIITKKINKYIGSEIINSIRFIT